MPETPPDATALAAAVSSGEVSAVELVEAAIGRIERVNPQINAVVTTRFEKALAEAAGDIGSGPFAGVPFLTKDLGCETAGETTYMGCRALKKAEHRAKTTAYLATHFRNAGFINLGRTSTPEFGSTITTEPLAFGACRNPWNLQYSTGGSSGGSAAAVAAGVVPVAHASDGGGSTRIPASECGLVGLKPSRGRISSGPTHGEGWGGLACEFIVGRTIRDTAAVLDATSSPMIGDPYWAPPPNRPFLQEVTADPGRLRVALVPNLRDGTVHADCEAAVDKAGQLLDQLGHDVTIESIELLEPENYIDDLMTVIATATVTDVDYVESVIGRSAGPDDLEPTNIRFTKMGREVSGVEYLAAIDRMHAYSRSIAQYWAPDRYDVMVTPTLGQPPPPIGHLSDDPGGAKTEALLRFTAQFNVTGQPAISLPLHRTADGLPVGVQFVGAMAAEALLIRLAAQIESAKPWAHHLPQLFTV